jgi:hypothetical protein
LAAFAPNYSSGNSSCSGSATLGAGFATSCFIGQALALHAFEGDLGPLAVIDAKLGARVLPEIELGQVTVEVPIINVLIDADDPALKDREKPFERVGVNVAARPFKLGVIDAFVLLEAAKLEVLRHVTYEAAVVMHHRAKVTANAAMIERHGTDVAAALHKAQDLGVMGAATEASRTARLARPRHFRFVGFDRDASAAQRANVRRRSHGKPNAMAKLRRKEPADISE